ncbi:MAG: 3-phosphoshikimate 1-carboxyvinyltransferase, partial [Planctomycetota bacterium]
MEPDAVRLRGLAPQGRVHGEFRASGSKSIAQRALVLASLAQGETRIAGLPPGEDVRAALALLRAVGVEVRELAPAAVAVRG